jgi:hypothetical protein
MKVIFEVWIAKAMPDLSNVVIDNAIVEGVSALGSTWSYGPLPPPRPVQVTVVVPTPWWLRGRDRARR